MGTSATGSSASSPGVTQGGDLEGTAPNPRVVAFTADDGTRLEIQAITTGQLFQRVGLSIQGVDAAAISGAIPAQAGDPAPGADGERYYNTTINLIMVYDESRSKWLSDVGGELWFGRRGNTGAGAFYRAVDGKAYGVGDGRHAEFAGTIVSITYTRGGVIAATFEVTADGVATGAELLSSAVKGSIDTLNVDFDKGVVLGGRNKAGGATTTDVQAWARWKWRSP